MKQVYELDVFVPHADPLRRNKLAEDLSDMIWYDFDKWSNISNFSVP